MSKITEYIAEEEGFRAKPYRCTAGKLTIGFGFNLDDVGLSREESEIILAMRLRKLAAKLRLDLPYFAELCPARQAVLIGMAYQMGLAGLYSFKATLSCIAKKDYDGAAVQMLKSLWSKQTPARAKRAAQMMQTGEFIQR